MRKFKSNYTSVEQSKRLLELGFPSWSADCIYEYNLNHELKPYIIHNELFISKVIHGEANFGTEHIPCWTVGRLLEIQMICQNAKPCYMFDKEDETSIIDCLCFHIEKLIKNGDMNLSLLEE